MQCSMLFVAVRFCSYVCSTAANTGCSSTAVTAASSSSGRAAAGAVPAAAAAAAAAGVLVGYAGANDPQYFAVGQECWEGQSGTTYAPIGSNSSSSCSAAAGMRPDDPGGEWMVGGYSAAAVAAATAAAPQQQQQQQQQQVPLPCVELLPRKSQDLTGAPPSRASPESWKRQDGLHAMGGARVARNPGEPENQTVATPGGKQACFFPQLARYIHI